MSLLDAKPFNDGLSFLVRVTPRAARDELWGVAEGELKVRLTAPPVEGAANEALLKFLAKTMGVPKSRLKVLSGDKSRHKKIWVRGLEPHELEPRLGL